MDAKYAGYSVYLSDEMAENATVKNMRAFASGDIDRQVGAFACYVLDQKGEAVGQKRGEDFLDSLTMKEFNDVMLNIKNKVVGESDPN